jgi:hypothetical protein
MMIPLFGIFRRQPGPRVEPDVLGTLSRVSGFLYCTAEDVEVQVLETRATTGWTTTPAGYSIGVVTVRVHVGSSDHEKDTAACARRMAQALGLQEQPREVRDDFELALWAGWLSEGSSVCPMRLEIVSAPIPSSATTE